MSDRLVTREDFSELREELKALEEKVDDLSSAMARIELELARSSAKSTLAAAQDIARLELELARYKGNAGSELSMISTRTAVLWGIVGAGGMVVFGALITFVVQKLFAVKP
jgi:chromosome segregation ATPase